MPVIVMTARSEVSNRVDLLDIGADDYIIKPFDFVELEARCRAVLRRHIGAQQTEITVGDITLNPLTAELRTPLGQHMLPGTFAQVGLHGSLSPCKQFAKRWRGAR